MKASDKNVCEEICKMIWKHFSQTEAYKSSFSHTESSGKVRIIKKLLGSL